MYLSKLDVFVGVLVPLRSNQRVKVIRFCKLLEEGSSVLYLTPEAFLKNGEK